MIHQMWSEELKKMLYCLY